MWRKAESLLTHIFSYLKERNLSGLLYKQMKFINLLPHQWGNRVTAGNDALGLSEKGQAKYCARRSE